MSEVAQRGKSSASCLYEAGRSSHSVESTMSRSVTSMSCSSSGAPHGELAAPAEEHRQVGDEERLDDARRRLRSRAAQRELDHLGHEAAIGVRHFPPLDLRPRVDPVVVGPRLGEEEDRPRRMPLGHSLERLARRLHPLGRHPRDVRHHRGAHARGLARGLRAQPRERRVHVGEADVLAVPGEVLQGRRHDRPSRWRSSSALGGPHEPAG